LLLDKQILNTKVAEALELMLKVLNQPDPSEKSVTHD
jgi:hypothetical protein